jgi:alanine-glyoxylate transaminase/serine-glyoxylate transaminase/serine-pyruvate transaminase
MVREHEALILVDAVTSLGGVPVEVDAWGLDAVYSGTQKCLSAPPGLAPATFGPRAVERIGRRKTKVQSWYLDLTMIEKYWGEDRFYHHTAPISMNYALAEALRIVAEEGLEARFARHARHHRALVAGLEAMGLTLVPEPEHRLPELNCVWAPEGVDEAAVRRRLLSEWNVEIGGGLGPLKGRAWRIGLMGYSARQDNVMLVLAGLETCLREAGVAVPRGAAVEAAAASYASGTDRSA